jgi:hypothetical protein
MKLDAHRRFSLPCPRRPTDSMLASTLPGLFAVAAVATLTVPADAQTVRGGGSKKTDCMVVLEAPGANHPAPPKTAKNIDCVDGDASCDTDGLRNARCVFDLQLCVNSTTPELPDCTPDTTDSVTISNAVDNGDRKFDPDWQALQLRVDVLGLPSVAPDTCAQAMTVEVPLKAKKKSKFAKQRKKLKLEGNGTVTGKQTRDKDKLKFTCRPEGDAIYTAMDLYEGTFDRVVEQVFLPSCAFTACHDDQSNAAGLNLLADVAYAELIDVTPTSAAAANAGLLRVTPGDADLSFLYRKIVPDLEAGWGTAMPALGDPVTTELLDIIELWILDGAPETGWVPGTDQ